MALMDTTAYKLELLLPPAKRRRSTSPLDPGFSDSATARCPNKDDYTVGWICALPVEMAASRTMFDEIHPSLVQEETDTNTYTLGRVREHNVVLVCLPSGATGTSPAATATANMLRSFPKIRFGLMVGVGGGAPGPPSKDACHDLRLGDVVVSNPEGQCGGVVQYDFGKTVATGQFIQTGLLNKPPVVLRSGVATLRALHLSEGPSTARYVSEVLGSKPNMAPKFQCPGQMDDLLFEACYDHYSAEMADCESCDRRRLVARNPRQTADPVIHYGIIGSANQVMRDGVTREKLRLEKNILCFEMEAAGLMDQFPCLVVRGICDYSDTHKFKQWQPYAAITAAAYAKQLLEILPATQVNATAEVAHALGILTTAINESLEPLKKDQQRKEELEILDWLALPVYEAQYTDNISRRQEGTGKWFLESPEFTSWINGDKTTLFCSGIPGSGKTILASAAIRYLLSTKIQDRPRVAFIFCNYRMHQEQTAEALLAAILRQVTEQCSFFPESIKSMYASYKSNRARPSIDDLLGILCSISRNCSRLFVVIDALDECLDSTWTPLFRAIRKLQREAGSSLMVTSRPNQVKSREFVEDIQLEVRAREEDIESFLRGQMSGLSDCIVRDPTLQASITGQITQLADGM
ncbi:purine and uridine phosphorylase [Aspergillus cavernicola]|uniref:Purine and uridine phosphorylase n=1 Tax=Aspergillus cavernicola TaxID=176166 RepID=A0ABR4ILD4_9EURO